MTLDVSITHRIGVLSLDVAFSSGRGITALFGRSGAGKTTVINVVAGLVRPDAARITVDGAVLVDTAARVEVAVHKRRLGYVFQEPRLFPHLNVRGNLGYGRWFQADRATGTDFDRVVDLLGLDALLERRPQTLSGGEKQRTAIGRALLASPRLLLMDEPLSALDDGLKQEILPYIERLRDEAGLPIVYVSHSLAEVARLAQTVVVLADGRVAAQGPASDVMQRADVFARLDATEAGALIEARVVAHDTEWGLTTLQSRAGFWHVPRMEAVPGTTVRMQLLARDVMIALHQPEGMSAHNIFQGRIAAITPIGLEQAAVQLDCNGEAITATITRASVARLFLTVGLSVFALVKTVAIEQNRLGG